MKLNSDTSKGYIRINSIDIKSSTPGITNANAWTGKYFTGVPVTITAIPEEGYEFDHWEGVTVASQTTSTITITPSSDTNLTAVFKQSQVAPTPTVTLLCGDLNEDGKVNAGDYTLLRRYLLNLYTIPQEKLFAVADLNLDNKVNAGDYTILRRYVLQIIPSLPYTN
jgi:hypothetical protein